MTASQGTELLRAALIAGVAFGLSACANEVKLHPSALAPMMMGGPAVAAPTVVAAVTETSGDRDVTRKSMAAKVLTARALEIVTGLKPDPARLSEHD